MTGKLTLQADSAPRSFGNLNHIRVLYMKASILIPKRNEFLVLIGEEKLDVIAITETWANSSSLMTESAIVCYESYHKTDSTTKGEE